MKAYIKQTTQTSLFEQARIGFIKMGYECIYYKDNIDGLSKEDVVVGFNRIFTERFYNCL